MKDRRPAWMRGRWSRRTRERRHSVKRAVRNRGDYESHGRMRKYRICAYCMNTATGTLDGLPACDGCACFMDEYWPGS